MDGGLAEQSAAQAVGGQGDLAHFDAGHAGDAVMFGEPLGEHGEARLHQRACGKVLGDQLAEEGRGLVGDALTEQEAVFRIEERVGVGLIQTAQLKPLAGEILREALGAGVGEQAVHLRTEGFGTA